MEARDAVSGNFSQQRAQAVRAWDNLILAHAAGMLENCQSTCRLFLGRSLRKGPVPYFLLKVGKRLRKIYICGEKLGWVDKRNTKQVMLIKLSTIPEKKKKDSGLFCSFFF